MGLWSRISQLVQANRQRKQRPTDGNGSRRCRFEMMESRRMLNADPLRVGAVYIEEDLGSDLHGDTFEITFEGGAAGTQLTRVIIDGDRGAPGFDRGDVFFDTAPGGYGADLSSPFQIVSFTAQDPEAAVHATVEDGSLQLVLDFVGFRAGDKLIFTIDVDEVQLFDPNETDISLINEGIDPITSGVEFQGSRFTTYFSAPHYHEISETAEFRNQYDRNFEGLGLNLPADDAHGKRDRTAGAASSLTQAPVLAEISGYVYHDRNNDGWRGPGEEGLAGVAIQVIPVDTIEPQSVVSLTTDANGFYHATGLIPGSYRIVQVQQPSGYFDGLDRAGTVDGVAVGQAVNPGDRLEGIFLGGGAIGVEYNFGELVPAAIRGSVHLTDRDGNCFGDSAQAQPLAGVVLHLLDAQGNLLTQTVTNAQGNYEFANLRPGEYSVVEFTPAGLIDGGEHVGTVNGVVVGQVVGNDTIRGIVLGSAQIGLNYNFCEHQPASLAGLVYHDANHNGALDPGEAPIGDVLITLRDDAGNTVATQRTGQDGSYSFTGLRAGSYTIIETQPQGWIDGRETLGTVSGTPVGIAANDRFEQVTLKWGDDGVEYNFGELLPVSLSGFVYHDRANNGVRDPGDDGLGGVQLQIIPVSTLSVQSAVTVTTNADGYYEATGLSPGEYRIVQSQPAGFQDGWDTAGTVAGQVRGSALNPGDEIREILLHSGEQGVQYNFGEYQLTSLSGRVHLSDADGNCFGPEENHPGIAGAVITLLDASGATLSQTITDAQGNYTFVNLLPGTYSVVEQTPLGLIDGGERAGTVNGTTVGRVGGNDFITEITLLSGQHGVGYDFCERAPASLSGNVYHDLANNGVFEPGDAGIGDVELILLDSSGNQVATTRTDADGAYQFAQLRADTYTIIERQPIGWLDGQDSVGEIGGVLVGTAGNDVISGITLRWGEEGIRYNFAEYLGASIAGVVHADLNQDCIIDPGEPRLEGVSIELLNEQGSVIANTETNANGEYRFDGLSPGVYSVREIQPEGYFHGGQHAGNGNGNDLAVDLITNILVISGDELINFDFCELPPASLSGYVFQDGDVIVTPDGLPPANLAAIRDGQLTPDDTPIPGVVVELRDGRTGLAISADQVLPGIYPPGPILATTDANGFYEFTGLLGGREYAVFQIHPDGFVDSFDTPGTTQGQAFNVGQLIPAGTLEQLATPHNNDAIVRIRLEVGGVSLNNNFSEVVVEAEPPTDPPRPPQPPLPPPPPVRTELPPVSIPPLILAPPGPAGSVAPLLNVYAGGVQGVLGYTWHLSVINGGLPRDVVNSPPDGQIWQQARYLNHTHWQADQMRQGEWVLSMGQPAEDQELEIRRHIFGIRGGVPVVGDFNGDGSDEIAVYYLGEWFIDLNGNGYWDAEDLWAQLGSEEDLPVTGDWDGDGKDDIGIFGPEWLGDPRALEAEPGLPDLANVAKKRPKNIPPNETQATDGRRLLQLNEQGPRRIDVIDHVFRFGAGKDIPVTGDWNGDGIRTVGIYRDGNWQLDLDGDGRWTRNEGIIRFGQTGDIPVVGDFNGDGVDELGVYRAGTWLIDSNGNRELDAHDRVFEMGGANDLPVAGDWNGDGVDTPGVYREVDYQRDTEVSN